MEKRGYRSLFWPIVLIGVGVIWLLGSMGVIPQANLNLLASMWPLILIVIGLDLLIGRNSPVGGALVGLIAVAVVVFLLIAGPSLGLATSGTLKTKSLSSSIGEATSATIRVDFASEPVKMYALDDKTSLLKGEIDYYGTLQYSETGNPDRRITLSQQSSGAWSIPWNTTASWDIGISPNLPIDLTIDGASGSASLDLSELRLTSFAIDQGSGSLTLSLPASTQAYTADIAGGSGSLTLNLPENADLTIRLDGASGSINIDVPDNTALQVEIRDAGSGSVNLPNWLDAVRVYNDNKEGQWETAGFDTAEHQITILCDNLGSGSFNLK